jgi:hypothetical protein
MDLETARKNITTCLERMAAVYRQPVFDEWAILAVPAKTGGIVAYAGARAEEFRRQLSRDAEPLRAAVAGKKFAEGDLEFVADAADTHYDAFMKIGPGSYLVLNHTVKTMAEIRADKQWLKAQAALFGLGEKFREDPLAT